MKIALLTATLMLISCAPGGGLAEPSGEVANEAGAAWNASSCQRAGGVMKPVGRMQTVQCVIAYADAGKSCTASSQCAGDCRTAPGMDVRPGQRVAGYCQASSDRFGCSTRVENGRAEATICID